MKILKLTLFAVVILFVAFLANECGEKVKADTYAPTDIKQFFVITYDTAYYPTLADVDSVKFFYWYNGNPYYDTTLTTSQDDSGGVYIRETSVCNLWDDPSWCDSTGSWGYYARAWSGGATLSKGAKAWDWTVELGDGGGWKRLYVRPDAEAIVGASGLTYTDACSISTVQSRCTNCDGCSIFVAAGTYKDVDMNITTGIWIGAGIGRTKVWGKKDGALPAEYIFRLVTTDDSSSIEVTGFEFHGYEATSGMEDSATFQAIRVNEPTNGFYIHDNSFHNFRQTIFLCASTHRGRIENNWISKPIECGFKIDGGTQHWIRNNVIDSLSAGRVGFHVVGSQGTNVFYNNVVNATNGRAFYFTSLSKKNIIVENYVRGLTDSAYVDAGANIFIANHMRSQISDPQTFEEDIYSVYVDADSSLDATQALLKFYGIFPDSGYGINWPPDGSANKDSTQSFDKDGNWMGSIIFRHHNTDAVIDTFVTKIEGY